jgi:addiction module RelE/StbE family toxin
LTKPSKSKAYQVIYGKDFLKDLKGIIKGGNKSIKNKVKETVEELKSDPHRKRPKVDLKLISSKSEAVYRVRLGKYRLVYEIDENEKKINITMIFPRGRGYRSILYLLGYYK